MPANSSQLSKRGEKRGKEWLAVNFKPENFIPGLIIGFVFGFLFDMAKPIKDYAIGSCSRHRKQQTLALRNPNEELKMVLVVRQDLKMGSGKIASQCAHAATGLYSELIQSQRALVRQWEHCGQAKIVVTCKNQQEMNKLKEMAENIGLPTYVVADAGRTQKFDSLVDPYEISVLMVGGQEPTLDLILSLAYGNTIEDELRRLGPQFPVVSSGSKTVLAIGPGFKSAVDSVTGKQHLL